MRKNLFTLIIFLAAIIPNYAQETFEPKLKKLETIAARFSSSLSIDGRLDEDAWLLADTISNFVQVEPNQGEPSRFVTKVFLLHDDQFLYVGAYMEDTKPGIRVSSLVRDFSFRANDTFAVGIDGFFDKRNTITFAVNPYGSQKDYLSYDDILFDGDWNGLWKVRTSITEQGWYAEFAIPWKSLRYDDNMGEQVWGVNFVRLQRQTNEISTWSSYPRSFGFNRAEYFGELHHVTPPKYTSNLQLNPYSVVSRDRTISEDETLSDIEIKFGGEAKWVVNPNLVLDATINTDFAQAEADRQVNNLGRSAVYFPERRQFFLENASLFSPGLFEGDNISGSIAIVPFFSREVGLRDGVPVPIDLGLRLVSKSVDRSFGLMSLRESSFGDSKGKLISVGRYSQNINKRSRIGSLFTSRINSDNANVVGGVDGFFRINSSQQISIMALQSFNNSDNKYGNAAYLSWVLNNNQMQAWFTQTIIGTNYDSELDFVSREDLISTHVGIFPNFRGKNLPYKNLIREFRPRISLNWYRKASTGQVQERTHLFSPVQLNLQNGGQIILRYFNKYQKLENNFSPLGISIAPGKYRFSQYNFLIRSDPSAKVAGLIGYIGGQYFDGDIENTKIGLTIRPIPHISMQGTLTRNHFKSVGVEGITHKVDLFTLENRFFLNPRIQLFGLYQRNTSNQSNAFNIKFTWEYTPLSYVYLVYNYNQYLDDDLMEINQLQAIFKVSFLKQF